MQSTAVGIWGAVSVCDPQGGDFGMERRKAGLCLWSDTWGPVGR